MRTPDIDTDEFLNPDTGEVTRRRARTETKRADGSPRTVRQKPVPDPEGPAAPRRQPSARKRREERRPRYTFISFLKDYRTHLGIGIVLCLSAIVMTLCSISFIFNCELDQSVINGRSLKEIVDAGDAVQNIGGPMGAKLASWFLIDNFGIGSFVLAFYVFVVGLAVMRATRISFFSFTFRCLFTTVALSVIVGLLTMNRADSFPMGGTHGFYVNWLVLQYADILGVYALTVLLAGLLVAVYLHPIKSFFGLVGSMMPRRKPVPEPVAESETEAEDETPSVLDHLDAPETVDEAETEPHRDSDTDEIDDSADAGDHSRFMPPVGLDDLDKKDDDEFDSDTDDIDESASEAAGGQTDVYADTFDDDMPSDIQPVAEESESITLAAAAPGEPEMVIKNNQPEKAADTDHAPIRNGDHISIDTPYDVRASHSSYQFPSTELLIERGKTVEVNEAEQLANKKLIVDALRSYNIDIQRIEATIGPTVTLYEIVPAQGTRIAKIKSLEDDIAMSLSALGIRIIAPIPGKGTVGIEVPNRKPQIVSMRTVLESKTFAENRMQLPMALGATISNDIYMADLAKMPHLLVAGATGQGKSVGLNCIITSLLYFKHPDELKFVLVDPKTVEFSLFETISRQYLAKLPEEEKAVITDPQKVIATLNSLCVEMDSRYELLSDARVRNIIEYNSRFSDRQLNPEKGHRFLPYIVVIVDEYADLVMVAGKDVAAPICRIAQKARAVGIHMIIATQRPSTDIITGMIKANFTARIAFKVTQGVDSKTILDRPGAQRLIGRGDMLTMMNGVVERVQCAFIDTPEVEAICDHIGSQPGFTSCYLLPEPPVEEGGEASTADYGAVTEEFKRCALFISSQSQASITSLQRKFEIGFNKAGRFMDQMQQMGIVGPAKGAKPRDVLMTPDEVQRLFE